MSAHGCAGAPLVGSVIKSEQPLEGRRPVGVAGAPRQKEAGRQPGCRAGGRERGWRAEFLGQGAGGGAAGSAGQRRAANGCIAVTPAGPLGGTVTERTCGPSVVRREGRGCL